MQQCFATWKGHVADFAVSLCAKDVPLSWSSAGLHPCGAWLELEASNVELKSCHPADCFTQETELLFGSQCRASWPSAGLHPCGPPAVEPLICLCFSIKNKYIVTWLIAFWKPVPHFLAKFRFASLWRISRALSSLKHVDWF